MRDEDKAAVQKSFLEHIGKVIKWRRNHLGVRSLIQRHARSVMKSLMSTWARKPDQGTGRLSDMQRR